MKELKTLCPYCGVGCGLLASGDGTRVTRIRGDSSHPANFGKICQKGATVAQTLDSQARLRHAMLREGREEPLLVVPRSRAIAAAAEKLDTMLQQFGPQAIAFYLSGQLTTESQYLFNKFAKGSLRTNHVDSNSRLCMSSAASAMTLSLGSDGPPTCYADIELADTFLFIGSNAAETHPITFARVQRRIEKSRAECIVVDPRRTATVDAATLHLPIRPGTDLALLNGLLYLLRADGKLDDGFIAGHTEGWQELSAMLDHYPTDVAARTCGIPVYDLVHAARIIGNRRRGLITFWTMGVNQSVAGTFTANAIINLHLALGQIGKPGCGPFSLTGQPNAMGGRDVGGMANLLSAHRDLSSEKDRAEVAKLWGVPSVPAKPGKTAGELFESLLSGEVRMVWIACTNPAQSMPDVMSVRRALAKAEFVVVQEAWLDAETCDYADVLLPAATWAEKEGTVTNSERRISRVRAAVPAPGEARPDWKIAAEFAWRLGGGELFPYEKSEDVFDEHRETT